MAGRLQKLYNKTVLNKDFIVSYNKINRNIEKYLLDNIKKKYEGKCISSGFVKINSCKIVSYSSGTILDGDKIIFNIVFECDICIPCEGLKIDCIVKNITKAGIRAEINEDNSPMIIFLARDHHYNNAKFSKIKNDDIISVKVIGKRFELNDKAISVLGELTDDVIKQQRITIED